MYLTVGTRPDIAFAVNYASQFLENPEEKHGSLVKRILKYIKLTSMGIRYKANNKERKLVIYTMQVIQDLDVQLVEWSLTSTAEEQLLG